MPFLGEQRCFHRGTPRTFAVPHLLATQTATYRLGLDASFKVLSIESRYPGSGAHLLLTLQ